MLAPPTVPRPPLRSPVLSEQFQAPGQLPAWHLPSKGQPNPLCGRGLHLRLQVRHPTNRSTKREAHPQLSDPAGQRQGHPLQVSSSCRAYPVLTAALQVRSLGLSQGQCQSREPHSELLVPSHPAPPSLTPWGKAEVEAERMVQGLARQGALLRGARVLRASQRRWNAAQERVLCSKETLGVGFECRHGRQPTE